MRDIAFPREIDRENAAHRLLATRARSRRGSIDQTRVWKLVMDGTVMRSVLSITLETLI